MRKTLLALLALTVGAATGCEGHMDGDASMRSQLEAGREELARHHQAVLGAQTLVEIRSDVALHARTMSDVMEGMTGAMEDMMSHCSGGNMAAMHARMSDMDAEMTAHQANMETAQTPEEARALCDEHMADMGAMMRDMETGMGMGMAGMECM